MATQPNNITHDERELVEVFSTQQESEALVVKGLLESAGIESLITADVGPQDVLPMGGVVVRVGAEFASQARKVIDESLNTPEVDILDQAESQLPPAGDAA